MVESEFERLGRTVSIMLERFSQLKEERNDLVVRLKESERKVTDLSRQVEQLSSRKKEAKGRLDGLISRLEKLNL